MPARKEGDVIRRFDPWGSHLCTCPPKYSLQPYTRCSHGCLYCYATRYVGVGRSRPKRDLEARVIRDLRRLDPSLPVELSTSSDPYPPEEGVLRLTRRVLRLLASAGFRILVTTKGDLVVRDADVLRGAAAVMITVTTLDAGTAGRLEPGAPDPEARLRAAAELSELGIPVGVRVDPVIPGLTDDPADLRELVSAAAEAGAAHVVTSTYKATPDGLRRMEAAFPGLAAEWRRAYRIEGRWIGGYWYLPRRVREGMLAPVVGRARDVGLTYATCREGLTDPGFFRAPSCDGTHLIPTRSPSKNHQDPGQHQGGADGEPERA